MEINRRNAAAVQITLQEMDAQIRAQQQRIDGLVATLGMFVARVSVLENIVNQQRAMVGGGPTVR
jgi:hypothetical protein